MDVSQRWAAYLVLWAGLNAFQALSGRKKLKILQNLVICAFHYKNSN